MARLVLFDIDGTLIRTGGAGVKAFADALRTEFGLPHATASVRFAGRTDTAILDEIFRRHDIDPVPHHFQRFFDSYVFWLDHHLHNLPGQPCPGVDQLLHHLTRLPSPPLLGLLTGNIRLGAELKLRRYNLWHWFRSGAFGDDHHDRNQIAAVARERGARLLQHPLPGQDIVVVGDTPHDIECARAIGARVLAVATGGSSPDELARHHPDWIAQDLSSIDPALLLTPPP